MPVELPDRILLLLGMFERRLGKFRKACNWLFSVKQTGMYNAMRAKPVHIESSMP